MSETRDPAVVRFLHRIDTSSAKLAAGLAEIQEIQTKLRDGTLSEEATRHFADELKGVVAWYVQNVKDAQAELSVAVTEYTLFQMSSH